MRPLGMPSTVPSPWPLVGLALVILFAVIGFVTCVDKLLEVIGLW